MIETEQLMDKTEARRREIAQARAEIERLAAEQGVKPITDISQLYGTLITDDEGNDDVDNFLEMRRKRREEEIKEMRDLCL